MIDLPFSPVLIWFLVGMAFFAFELALPGFIVFFFGIGACCTALAIFLYDSLPLTSQLIIFLVASVASLLILRSYLRGVFVGESKKEKDSVTFDPAPATGVVTKPINPPALGQVKYAGSFWNASAEEAIAEETVVEIVEQQDLLIKVRPVQQ